jgi:hypothetical protein
MELSDYVRSGTWTLTDAPAKIRIIQSSEPPYESRTEMVFFMGKSIFSFFISMNHYFSYSTKIFILYNKFNRSNINDLRFNNHIILFTK